MARPRLFAISQGRRFGTRPRGRLRGPLLLSSAFHALVLLALAVRPRSAPHSEMAVAGWTRRPPGPPVEVAVMASTPRPAPREAQATPAAGGRPPGTRVRRDSARAGGTSPLAAPPAPLSVAETAVATAELPAPIGAPSPPAETPATSEQAAPAEGPPGADGEGRGTGEGDGSGSGAGDGTENLGKELHARILGDVSVDLPRDDQHRTVLTHDQATALRQRDSFPRLPESLWPAWRPYVVTLRVCVDVQGQVSDATLLSSAAPRLDRMVATAARGWRYRPFEPSGQATAFCHAVVIQYEHW